MTLGVAGIGVDIFDMSNGLREGTRVQPFRSGSRVVIRKSQRTEWRCLSFRDERAVVVKEGNEVGPAKDSSG